MTAPKQAVRRTRLRADGPQRASRIHCLRTRGQHRPHRRSGRRAVKPKTHRPDNYRRAGEDHPARHRPRAAESFPRRYPRPRSCWSNPSPPATSSNRPASRPALDAIHASATHASAQSLKIQLHPAELGMVTATLRFAGEQLSIELAGRKPRGLSPPVNDSETIVKSLRDLGYDIERVICNATFDCTRQPAGRSDTSASMPSPQGRAGDQFGSGAAGSGNRRIERPSAGKDGGNAGRRRPAKPCGGQAEQPGQRPLHLAPALSGSGRRCFYLQPGARSGLRPPESGRQPTSQASRVAHPALPVRNATCAIFATP